MFTQTPQEAIALLDPHGSNNANNLLQCLRGGTKFYVDHANSQPKERDYIDLVAYYEEISEIKFSLDDVKTIVTLSPHLRIKLAEYDGLGDTEVRDLAADALAAFLLHTTWPNYGDRVNSTDFVGALKQQAQSIGLGTQHTAEKV